MAIEPTSPGLPRAFFARDTRTVARELLGMRLVRILPDRQRLSGRIVETEAYRPGDQANHAWRGKTDRNAPMFGPPGMAYVYFAYGAHHLFNVVTEGEGIGAAVLVRALEPVDGVDFMRARSPKLKNRDLCRGPGRLCKALAIDLSLTGYDMHQPGSVLFFEADTPVPDERVQTSPRVGVTGDATALTIEWRWFVAGSPFVSGTRMTTDNRRPTTDKTSASIVHGLWSTPGRHNVALTGFSTTGKSTAARLLAETLGWEAVDTDQMVVARAGKPVPAIFADDGEPAFRRLEADALADALAGASKVIATGGGVVVSDANRALLRRRAWTVCLTARPETILARLARAAPSEPRPLLDAPDPLDRVRGLLEQRQAAYADADLTVPTDERTPAEVVAVILDWLKDKLNVSPLHEGEGQG